MSATAAPKIHLIIRPVRGSSFAKAACRNRVVGHDLLREGSSNPAEVTCKKCLASHHMRKATTP